MSSPPPLSDLSIAERHPLKGLHEARGIRKYSLHSRSSSAVEEEEDDTTPTATTATAEMPEPEAQTAANPSDQMLSEVSPEVRARIQAHYMSLMSRDRAHSSPPEPDHDHQGFDSHTQRSPMNRAGSWQIPRRDNHARDSSSPHPHVTTDFGGNLPRQPDNSITSPDAISPFTIAKPSSVPKNQGQSFQSFQTGSMPKSYHSQGVPSGSLTAPLPGGNPGGAAAALSNGPLSGPLTGPLAGPLTGPMTGAGQPPSRQSSLSSRRGMRLPGSPLVSDSGDSTGNDKYGPGMMNLHLPDYSKLSYNGEKAADARSRESSSSSSCSIASTTSNLSTAIPSSGALMGGPLTAPAGLGGPTGSLTGPTGQSGARLPGRLSSQNSIKRKGPGKLSLSGSPGSSPVAQNATAAAAGGLAPLPQDPPKDAAGGGLFAHFSKIVDISTGSLNFAGKASLHSKGIDFSGGSSFRINIDELEPLGELGRGNYGTVTKVLHKPTGITMAMKEVKLELDQAKFAQIIMELDILHKCASPYIVDFFGAFFVEGAVYECIEYMDGGSLDKVYAGGVDEPYLSVITDNVVRGLMFLKEEHSIIHRDVKPTNILINTQGKVKLCDFGVSGNLVASKASTVTGCQSYMAPERIHNPDSGNVTYTANSDIWSLGVSILEIAQGSYPYPSDGHMNVFAQLRAIVSGEPPQLSERFSPEARDFVAQCLQKKPYQRPTYQQLLVHPWLKKYQGVDVGMADFVVKALERRQHATSDTTVPSSSTATVRPGTTIPTATLISRDGRQNPAPAMHRTFMNNNRQ